MRTKQDRLIALIELYRRAKGVKSWTNEEVSEWVIYVGLDEIPSIRNTQPERDAWDKRFYLVKDRIG